MGYTPGAGGMSIGGKSAGYCPGSASQNEQEKSFIAPDLQKLIDEHVEREKASQKDENLTHLASTQGEQVKREISAKGDTATEVECWKYLRQQRNKLLQETDNVNMSSSVLSFEQRGKLYRYRQALRDLPAQAGAPWTPSTIPWPSRD